MSDCRFGVSPVNYPDPDPDPPWGMDPGVRSHGMKADPPEYLWSKYECFLMSGSCDIPHLRSLHIKLCLKFHICDGVTNERMNKQTNGRKDE